MKEKNKKLLSPMAAHDLDLLKGEEIKSKRTRFSKVFSLGGNRFQAVTYTEPVHHFNSTTGEWEEKEVVFHEKVTLKNNKVLQECNLDHLRISCSVSGNETFISLTNEKNQTLSWGLEDACTIHPEKEEKQKRITKNVREKREEVLKNLQGTLTYPHIFPDVHLRCLINDRFKDEIIYEKESAVRPIAFLLSCPGMTMTLKEDQQILITDNQDTLVYRMPAPYLVDAKGNLGEATVSLEATASGYRMLCTPDPVFCKQATYPVVLDPAVETARQESAIEDTYVQEGKTTNFSSGTELWICNNSYYGKRNAYLRVKQLPPLGTKSFITSAHLFLFPAASPNSNLPLCAREVTAPWDVNTINYANQPTFRADYYQDIWEMTSGQYKWCDLDITNLARKWYRNTEDNHGVVLVPHENNFGFIRLQSMNATTKPYFVVNYSSLSGLESYLSYDQHNAGRAGTGHVSLLNGNLILSHQVTSMDGARLPVSITNYYNSCDSSNDFHMGIGWRTSFHQTLHKVYLNEEIYFVYTDGDGTEHYFEASESTPSEYEDMSGLSMKLVPDDSSVKITDKLDNSMVFPPLPETPTAASPVTSRVLLCSVSDAVGNTITIASDGLKITSITDGSGRTTNFIYHSNTNLCEKIVAPYQRESENTSLDHASTFFYEDGYLTKITHHDSSSVTESKYTYDTVGTTKLLISMEDSSNTKVFYSYTNQQSGSGCQHHISSSRIEINNATVQWTEYEYGNKVTLLYDKLYNDHHTDKRTLRYHFNDNGNNTSIDDSLGHALYSRYDRNEDNANAPINHATMHSRMQKVVTNLLSDTMMDDNNGSWANIGNGTFIRDASTCQWGIVSRKITPSANSTTDVYSSQSVQLVPGESYTLSGYVKSNGPIASLRILYSVNGIQQSPVNSDPIMANDATAFKRVAVSFTLPSNADDTVQCCLVCSSAGGSAWFDCIQLERGLTLNHFNMLQNSTFSKSSSVLPVSWQKDTAVNNEFVSILDFDQASPVPPSFLTGRILKLTGLYYRSIHLYQQFRMNGHQGDRFSAGGWCCAYAKRNSDYIYCRINVLFGQGTTQWTSGGTVEFNHEEGNWQFASAPIKAPVDYTHIRFIIQYNKQMNHAFFTNLYLYPEQFGSEFVYDEKGNTTSASRFYKKIEVTEYDDFNNLILHTAAGRTLSSTFDYGATDEEKKKHLLHRSVSPLGTIQSFEYNAYGQVTEAKIQDEENEAKVIQTTTSYDNKGNYPLLLTDARGKSVTKEVDPNSGTVSSVTDPNGQKVSYTYDKCRRVTEVSATLDNDSNTSPASCTYVNKYTYKDTTGQLTSVRHNTSGNSTEDVIYTFDYDAQNRPLSVSVGSGNDFQILSSNVYNNDAADANFGTLQRVNYGNGHFIRNHYDTHNRLIGIGINSNTASHYTFAYNAMNQVAQSKDLLLNRIQESEYDLDGRPCRVKLHENNIHLYTGEVHYDSETGNLAEFSERVGSSFTSYKTTFAYDDENRITALNYGDSNNNTTYSYDKLGRLTNKTLCVDGSAYTVGYSYLAGSNGDGNTTGLISQITQTGETCSYTYDNVGNITSSTRNGVTTTYVYDALGQLIRVNDPYDTASGSTGTTWTYEYDRGGNILNKKRYVYTTGTLGNPMETIPYAYSDTNWKDKLTSFNGVSITYDAIGNPLNDGTWAFTWEKGRQLKEMTHGTTSSADYKKAEFKYNADGLRVEKKVTEKVNGTNITSITKYTLHGKNIVHMNQGNNDLHFWYDAQNRPAIVEFNGTKYGYILNLQGDVLGLVDSNGTEVVKYVYDAWGKILSTTGSLASTLGTIQPFRYRGYVYDEETGLYYLRSRYYNPVVGRFICPDVITDQHITLLSHNLFTYCLNTPTMRTDAEGMWGNWFAAIVTVAVAVVAAAAVIAAAPVIASAVGTTAFIMGASSATMTAVSTAATIACVTVAGSTILCGVNQSVEIVTGTNYGERLLGEAGYSFIEDTTYTAAAMISMAPNYLPYPSTGRTEPANLKEQMKYRYAIEDGTKGKVIVPYLKDARMPGWLGWQKYSIKDDGVDIHYVGHRFLPVRFDYKIK